MNTEELAKELNRPLVNLGYLCPNAGTLFMEVTFDAKIKEPSRASSRGVYVLAKEGKKAAALAWGDVLRFAVQAARSEPQFRADLEALLASDGSNDLALLQAFNERAEAIIAERQARRAAAGSGQ